MKLFFGAVPENPISSGLVYTEPDGAVIEDSAEAAHTSYVHPFLALGVSVCGPPLLHIPRMYTNTSFYARFDVHTSPKRA